MPVYSDRNFRSVPLALGLTLGLGLLGCDQPSAPQTPTQPLKAEPVLSGTVECFPGDTAPAGGKPPTCELSAVAFDGTSLVFANDKPAPDPQSSPVFAIDYRPGAGLDSTAGKHPLMQPAFTGAIKYEGMAVSPDGAWVFATTAFDRYDADKPDFDRYNTVLVWPAGQPDAVRIVAGSERQGIASSVGLWEKFLAALDAKANGIAYFKVEGLAVLPGNRLLFGLREVGKDYKHFDRTIRLIEVGYTITDGVVTLNPDFTSVYDFKPDPKVIPHTLGLSSVEYDRFNDRIYLLTSFEEGEPPDTIGAYLWTLRPDDLRRNQPPMLVNGPDGKPLAFTHKAEGLTVLDADHILVIDDDDRIPTLVETGSGTAPRVRNINESPFQVLKWD